MIPRRPSRVRLALVAGTVALVPALLGLKPLPGAAERACRELTFYAEQLPSSGGAVRLGYGLAPGKATIPGPLVELTVGDCVDITLVNNIPAATLDQLRRQYGGDDDLPLAVSLHPHGVKYDRASDGTVSSRSYVLPGGSRVFRWRATDLSPGYWWYHDHVVGTHHGTGGIGSGLFGGLVVRRPGDVRPDVPTFVVAMGDGATINLKRHPETPQFAARQGQRVEFLVFAWGNETHSFHLHGHTWADNRTGILDPSDPGARIVDNVTLAPASSFGFQVVAGQDTGPNRWMYHCHVQFHSDLGMHGFLRVIPA